MSWPKRLADGFPYPDGIHRESDDGGVVKRRTDRNEYDPSPDGSGDWVGEDQDTTPESSPFSADNG